VEFSLFYFANQGEEDDGGDKYRLILESAKWADQHGFTRLWIPERHFHSFGGLSPNPSILAGVLAAITQKIQICSGSVVLPLHDPIRVTEEWSVVDNISHGRVGLGVACGWVPNDFVISNKQDSFECRKELFAENIQTIRKLWRGDHQLVTNPQGKEIAIQTLPRPIQKELPIWITAAANPETFRQAGDMGVGVLTHLLGQTVGALAEKIVAYRQAWKTAGHPGKGTITLMLHTFVGSNDKDVHDLVRKPMKQYLAGSLDLAAPHLQSVPFLRDSNNIDISTLTPEVVDQTLEASFEKYFHMSGLFGSYEKCLDMVDKVEDCGVDEIACLVDFGVNEEIVLGALEDLNLVRILANPKH